MGYNKTGITRAFQPSTSISEEPVLSSSLGGVVKGEFLDTNYGRHAELGLYK